MTGPIPESEIILYQTEDGDARIDVRMAGETVWLSQAQMVELFQSSKANVSEHIRHVFDEGELDEAAVVRSFRTPAPGARDWPRADLRNRVRQTTGLLEMCADTEDSTRPSG